MSNSNLPILAKPSDSAANQVTPVPVAPSHNLTIQMKSRTPIIPPPVNPLEQLVCIICVEESIPPYMLSDIFHEAYSRDPGLPPSLFLLDTNFKPIIDSFTPDSATIPPVDEMFWSPFMEMNVDEITNFMATTCHESILSTGMFFLADDLTAATETLRKVEVGKTLDWDSSRVAWRDANVVAVKWTRGYGAGMSSSSSYQFV
ncbi:hypothetical protein AbraIFM66951_003938 [Aspergillus brasiliensis]|uniref:Uncharacterized protein n=1 Tax=Aspergillus brasiliensis TaxID=319629 RepID=A0A9W6DS70_9EURO|nr:hypothetical protein AbraCBS73388_003519 [Aspergillus brasiliensis]GKZ50674.1 hypothetical protein AbraIFM66951_003938 [Aspergillus brasiliensis]